MQSDEGLVELLVVALEAGGGGGVVDVVMEDDVEIVAGPLGFDVEKPVGGLEEGLVAHGEGEGEETTGLIIGPSEALEVGVLEAVDGEGDPRELGLEVVDRAELVGDGVAGDVEVGAESPDLVEELELGGVDEVVYVNDEGEGGGVIGELHFQISAKMGGVVDSRKAPASSSSRIRSASCSFILNFLRMRLSAMVRS